LFKFKNDILKIFKIIHIIKFKQKYVKNYQQLELFIVKIISNRAHFIAASHPPGRACYSHSPGNSLKLYLGSRSARWQRGNSAADAIN